MKKDKSKDQPFDEPLTEERSDLEWEEDEEDEEQNELNRKFDQLLEEHKELLDRITPINPVITKDDEWYYEDCWDEDFKQQCLKEEAEKSK